MIIRYSKRFLQIYADGSVFGKELNILMHHIKLSPEKEEMFLDLAHIWGFFFRFLANAMPSTAELCLFLSHLDLRLQL